MPKPFLNPTVGGISPRAANRGILLADFQSDEVYSISVSMSNDAQSSSITRAASSSTPPAASVSAFKRLKQRLNELWLSAVRKWPTITLVECLLWLISLWCWFIQVLPIARDFLQLVICANLMFFYFEGMF